MVDKDNRPISLTIDEFFDLRAIAAVLLGFTFIEWIKSLMILAFGMEAAVLATIWPILFVFFVIVMANSGKQTNHEIKKEEFEEKIEELVEREVEEQDDD